MAIHAYGTGGTPAGFGITANSAPRIIPEVLDQIEAWIAADSDGDSDSAADSDGDSVGDGDSDSVGDGDSVGDSDSDSDGDGDSDGDSEGSGKSYRRVSRWLRKLFGSRAKS